MAKWWDHNQESLPELDQDTRKWVEDITGCIPLLLRPLFQFKGERFDKGESSVDNPFEEKFLSCDEIETVTDHINAFYEAKILRTMIHDS